MTDDVTMTTSVYFTVQEDSLKCLHQSTILILAQGISALPLTILLAIDSFVPVKKERCPFKEHP